MEDVYWRTLKRCQHLLSGLERLPSSADNGANASSSHVEQSRPRTGSQSLVLAGSSR
jgi:hypothetical protein